MKVTIAQFFRVSGAGTQHRGGIPDFVLPTMNEETNQRERSYKNALPWSEIKPSRYRLFSSDVVEDNEMDQIKQRHTKRISTNAAFKYITDKTQLDLSATNKNWYSLLESKRREEVAAYEQQEQLLKARYRESLVDPTTEVDFVTIVSDAILQEAGHILIDMIHDRTSHTTSLRTQPSR